MVTGQSASRMHPCLKGFCTQQWNVTVADGAVLLMLPGPAIPFAATRFFQRVHVDLGRDARMVWGDLWFAGRYARAEASERFRFERIVQDMTVQREGKLIYRDRFVWDGPWSDESSNWHFGGQPVAGSIFATGTFPADSLTAVKSIRMAEFTTFAGDTCYRFIGPSNQVVHAVVQTALRLAATSTSGAIHEPWLLKDHHLAPVQWFDTSADY
jgi:urease accessory protein